MRKELSRECIRDTLLAKRVYGKRINRMIGPLYNHTIVRLRQAQLAPYIEKAMRTNRILEMQDAKRHAPEVVVVMRGGVIAEVRSTNPFTAVVIDDQGEYNHGMAQESAATTGMYEVYPDEEWRYGKV